MKRGVTIEDLEKPDINIEDWKTESKRFLYFFLAPTLVYRDKYVYTKNIRWQFILKQFMTFMFLVFYIWTIFKALCIPEFKDTVNNPNDLRQFIHSVLFSTVSGIVCLLALFYGVLHSWSNMFAEFTKFGDRLFYEDWWNVKDFAGYYRKWNIIVHEFLYYYVYQDLIRFRKGKISDSNAKFFVFFFSAAIHEIVVTCGLGFFYPILFAMFGGPGVLFTRFKFGNGPYVGTIFWLLMLIGCGLLMTLISREWYARNTAGALTFEANGWVSLWP